MTMAQADYTRNGSSFGRNDRGQYPPLGESSNRDYDARTYDDRRSSSYDDDRDDDVAMDETTTLIASNKVEGTAVYDRNGERMGSIYNFMVNKRSGEVEYAVLTFGGFMGMGRRYYPLPWDMLDYDIERGGYVVDMDEDDLHDAPSFKQGETPWRNRDYSRYVYGYYGVPF
jgi:sporulation protein YlmC with PRC-barrel domain